LFLTMPLKVTILSMAIPLIFYMQYNNSSLDEYQAERAI